MAAQWFVLETAMGREAFTKKNLAAQGFETYMPLFIPSWGLKPKIKPFLPGYLFISTESDGEEARWNAILTTLGVRTVLYSGDRPASVPGAVITELRQRERDGIIQLPGNNMDMRQWQRLLSRLKQGDVVKILGSALQAVFDEAIDRRRAGVLVEFLGRKHRKIIPFSRLTVG